MDLAKIENVIGHKFQRPELLELALTHRSWAYEKLKRKQSEGARAVENEALEFVGDSVLGLAVAEYLYTRHTAAAEGELTLMKHRLVSMKTLAGVSSRLGLGEYLRIGRGEEISGGREKPAILADTLEAVIGAIFFDGGYTAASSFVTRALSDELGSVTANQAADHKSQLQERLQAQKLPGPVYRLIRSEGQPHDRTFYVEAEWDGGKANGEGRSIKAAEMMAASRALEKINGN